MSVIENAGLRITLGRTDSGEFFFTTQVRRGDTWQPACHLANRPVDSLTPRAAGDSSLSGVGQGFTWRTAISPQGSGFRLETVIQAARAVDINPMMVLWLGSLDNLNDRQAHTWRQTILRAPTVNQQGLPGNDLAAAYLYDHATHVESICYFPADAFAWAPHRFYHFTVREVMAYRPTGRYGLGLVLNEPEALFHLEPGEHRLTWWFTQHYRVDVPSPWEAQNALIEAVEPLLDVTPTVLPDAVPWQTMAQHTLRDLEHEACWVELQEQKGLRAYVRGSSAVGRDEQNHFELMTQLDVLWPLLLWQREVNDPRAEVLIDRIRSTLPLYDRPALNYVTNNFPPHARESFMDTWYFFENALIKLPWVAYLTSDGDLQAMFFTALEGARTLAHHTGYLFPLFADAGDWQPRNSLLNVSVGGLYAAGCVLAYQLSSENTVYLREAAQALRVMHQLPPYQLTHEPQQLSFAAASAAFLAQTGHDETTGWSAMAADFARLVLRMGYWSQDPAVPFYDPRGMFQACASLCYPAFKENVEVLIAWPELLRHKVAPAHLMAAFANLQRCHNYAFFDPYLPADVRRGPCAYIPYEDLATAEFEHTGRLGKELYGTGEVFWSALLFDLLGHVDAPDVLCLCLDVSCLELHAIPPATERRFLVYNPADDIRQVVLQSGGQRQALELAPASAAVVMMATG